MKKYFCILLMCAAAMSLATSCSDKDSSEGEATLSFDKTYADLAGEAGSTAEVTATTNCPNLTAEKETESETGWFSIAVDGKKIILTALSTNGGEDERWANVIVTATGKSADNKITKQFTVRQAPDTDAVRLTPAKMMPVLSAAAYGETAGYGGVDNRYKVAVTMLNTTDFNVDWDRSATWITNVEKYYDEIDGAQVLGGIMISAEKHTGAASRDAEITLSVDGADYADVTLTLFQKANPFTVALGDYDVANKGTVVYLDIENYNFYLILDNVEFNTPFYGETVTFTRPTGASSSISTRVNVDAFRAAAGEKFTSTVFPALYHCFNRNAPSGTTYAQYSDIPAAVIDEDTYWHLPTRNDLAYVFKRTIYENYVPNNGTAHTFNTILERNAAQNSVTITNMATTGTIYWASQEHQSTGSNAGYLNGYATTNLNSTKTNNYSTYDPYRTNGYARCVKKVVVDSNE